MGGGHCGGEEGAYNASYNSFSVVVEVWPFFFVVDIGIVGCVGILLLLLVVGSITVAIVVVVAVVAAAADTGIALVAAALIVLKTIAVKLFHLFLFCSMMDGEYGIAAFYNSIIIIDFCTVVRRNVVGCHILNRCFPWARTPIVITSIRRII